MGIHVRFFLYCFVGKVARLCALDNAKQQPFSAKQTATAACKLVTDVRKRRSFFS
jgi:hypothetical protein